MSRKRPNRNRYVRFTSNVLRSGGIINDAVCFLLAYGFTVVVYQGWFGYYYDTRLHSTAVIVMAINFFLIRISRDA
ncbi:MAG: undecaprenyl-phosphate glucose phosphotransferase, partial [Sphingomonadales bacterium]|nr:undecaprenyl-phosphate glucose phosphotransferase [Sphingomonadales bacterium]